MIRSDFFGVSLHHVCTRDHLSNDISQPAESEMGHVNRVSSSDPHAAAAPGAKLKKFRTTTDRTPITNDTQEINACDLSF
jgi:hypothetical protein